MMNSDELAMKPCELCTKSQRSSEVCHGARSGRLIQQERIAETTRHPAHHLALCRLGLKELKNIEDIQKIMELWHEHLTH